MRPERRKIVIPAPAFAELLTAIGPAAQQYIDIVSRSRFFEIAPFDIKCAIELAMLNRGVFAQSDQKNKLEPYQKVKFDRQIVAICKAAGVDEVFTDDPGLAMRAEMCGMKAIATHEIPIPPADAQLRLEFETQEELPDAPNDEI